MCPDPATKSWISVAEVLRSFQVPFRDEAKGIGQLRSRGQKAQRVSSEEWEGVCAQPQGSRIRPRKQLWAGGGGRGKGPDEPAGVEGFIFGAVALAKV